MKINKKPDIMLMLVLFVLIGVVFSTLANNEKTTRPDNIQEQDASVPVRTQNNDSHESRGSLLRVSIRTKQSAV